MIYKKMLEIFQKDNLLLLINKEIKINDLNLNSSLGNLAEFLFYEYNIEISDYGKVEFLFQNMIYDDFNLRLEDIGNFSDHLIIVKKETFPTAPMRPCTLYDRDHYRDYPDGIRFELSLGDKINFVLERCLLNTSKTGNSYLDILKYKLSRTDNRFEIRAIQKVIDEIRNLNKSYQTEIRKCLGKIN